MNDRVKDILEWVYCIVIAIVLALLVRYFVGTPTIVQQPSMFPTLKPEQRLILNRWVRTIKETPKRGNIMTFQAPNEDCLTKEEYDKLDKPIAIYNNEDKGIFGNFVYNVLEINKKSYIKRVIGLPGEHVKIEDGKVFIDGKQLDEPYLQPGVVTDSLKGQFTDFIVPEDCVFLMGDNRSQSTDCRRFGCIPYSKLESKVVLRFWPLNLFGKVE